MLPTIQLLRRGLAATLVGLHLALALGAGAHVGAHVDPDVARLPIELHRHAHALDAASPEAPSLPDLCVACQFSKLVPRMPASPAALPAVAGPARASLPAVGGELQLPDLDLTGPRAPPIV